MARCIERCNFLKFHWIKYPSSFQACTSFQDGVFQGTDIKCIDCLLV